MVSAPPSRPRPIFINVDYMFFFFCTSVSYEKIFYASTEGRRKVGGGMSELRLMLLLLYPFKASSEQQSVNFYKTDKLTFLETIWQFLDFSKASPKKSFQGHFKGCFVDQFSKESLFLHFYNLEPKYHQNI